MDSKRVEKQVKVIRKMIDEASRTEIVVYIRYDDSCDNGHNTFSITANIYQFSRLIQGGCIHDEIVKHFPELEYLIKWHLCSSDGPMHYIENTLYHAGDKDYNGLRKGETRQIRNGKTNQLAWKLLDHILPKYFDSDTRPMNTVTLYYEPRLCVGEGKTRDLDAARRSAVWLDARDEELIADNLKQRLEERLPALLERMRADIESLGFIW